MICIKLKLGMTPPVVISRVKPGESYSTTYTGNRAATVCSYVTFRLVPFPPALKHGQTHPAFAPGRPHTLHAHDFVSVLHGSTLQPPHTPWQDQRLQTRCCCLRLSAVCAECVCVSLHEVVGYGWYLRISPHKQCDLSAIATVTSPGQPN